MTTDDRDGVTPGQCVCGSVTDAATSLLDRTARPVPGDFSVCADCGAIMIYDEDIRPVIPTPQEIAAAPPELLGFLRFAQAAVRALGAPARKRMS